MGRYVAREARLDDFSADCPYQHVQTIIQYLQYQVYHFRYGVLSKTDSYDDSLSRRVTHCK